MKRYEDMTIPEFVEALHIVRKGDKCGSSNIPYGRKEEFITHLKAVKPQVMEYLLQQEDAQARERKERNAKINAIPGLQALETVLADLAAWREEFNASFESEGGGGVGVRPKPQYDVAAMRKKYPQADAYLKTEAYEQAENYVKSAAGRKAKERIINGEDPATVLAEMETEWAEYCARRVMD